MRRLADVLAVAACVALSGCAGLDLFGEGGAGASPAAFRDPATTVQRAAPLVVVGQSTKQQVAASLGPAETFRFDSGYEVWAWRGKPAKASASQPELVVLFSPDGIARKVRARTPGSLAVR